MALIDGYRIDDNDPDYQTMLADVAAMRLDRADGQRFDAGETAFIARQLLYIKAKTFDVKYQMFKARDYIPVSHDVPSGAEQWAYWSWDMVGMAKVIANYATDFESVDAYKKETIQNIKSLGAKYSYTVQDLRRAAMMSGVGGPAGQLDAKRAAMARRAIEAAIDDIAAVGLADAGLQGLANNPNVPVVAAPVGTWATATAAQMLSDLNFAVQKVVTQSGGVEVPDSILAPLAEYGLLSTVPYSANLATPVLAIFKQNSPYVNANINQWAKLGLANAGGTGGRIVIYRNDENALTLEIPQEFEQFAPQQTAMTFEIPCHARIGGVIFYYPLSAVYMDGTS